MIDSLVLSACFRTIDKEAGAANTAAHVGAGALSIGKDIGRTVGHTFNPHAWREGAQTIAKGPAWEKLLVGGLTAGDAVHTARENTDHVTGRHLGYGERAALTASHIGSGLASYKVTGGNIARGMMVGIPAAMATDAIGHRIGKLVDDAGNKALHHAPVPDEKPGTQRMRHEGWRPDGSSNPHTPVALPKGH